MKDITNSILIILLIAVIAFGGFVAFNIFQAPKQNKPVAPPASQPIEETVTPEPQTPVGAGLVPAPAGPSPVPPAQAQQTDEGAGLVPDQTDLRIQSLIGRINSDNVAEALKAEDDLVNLGKPALKELVNTLNNLEPQEDILRPEIAFILGRFEDTEAIPALISLLENENSYIRRNTVDALGKIRGKEAVPALINKLSDEDELVRERAVSALGEIRGDEATDALLERLKDENESGGVKLAAIQALAQIKDSRASQELLKQLKNASDPFYKDEVVDSLADIADIGDNQTLSGLTEYLDQLKNNKPQDPGDLFSWENSIEITEQAIQRLNSGY